MAVTSETTFFTGLREALDAAIHEYFDDEIEKACESLRQKLRARVGAIATSVLDHYTAENYGRELRITVKLPEKIQ